mmetsp:Transcript_3690/g.7666  ORF Transcript_3690/g.7666 Transcript_3690/m.7666 type:complete len:209 (+) Transcript_3690:1057-1683(+)
MANPNKRRKADDAESNESKRVKIDPSLTDAAKMSKAEMFRKATGIPKETRIKSEDSNLRMRYRTSTSAGPIRHTTSTTQFEAKSQAAKVAIAQANAKTKEAEEAIRQANAKSQEADEAIARANARSQEAKKASNETKNFREAFATFEARSQEITQCYAEWQTGAQGRQTTAESAFRQAQAKVKAAFEAHVAAQKTLKDEELPSVNESE